MIAAFHPLLKLDRIIVYRSFAHDLNQLSTVSYFTREQINFVHTYLTNMSKDYASELSKKKCRNNLGRMFSVESALVKKTLLKWFNAKFKRTFVTVDPFAKMRFEATNKINWQKDKCVICKFPMKLNATNFENSAMTYADFVIRLEHTFL